MIKDLLRKIKFHYQRGKRGWADQDCWNIDLFLMEVLPPMLKHLAKNHCGCPTEFFQEGKKNPCGVWEKKLKEIARTLEMFDKLKDGDGYWVKTGKKRYSEMLKKEVDEEKFNQKKWDEDFKKWNEAWRWVGDNILKLWD